MWVLVPQDILSKPSTTANVNSEVSQIPTQYYNLMHASDLRYKLHSINFWWEELIKAEWEKHAESRAKHTNTYTGLGIQLAESQDLEFLHLSTSALQDTSISQLLPSECHGCQAKAFLKASGYSKSGLLRADNTRVCPANPEAAWPQTLCSAFLFTLCKLSPALAKSLWLLHRCTLKLQFTFCWLIALRSLKFAWKLSQLFFFSYCCHIPEPDGVLEGQKDLKLIY